MSSISYRRPRRLIQALLIGWACAWAASSQASTLDAFELRNSQGMSFWRSTHLLEVKYDADHSRWLESARTGGYDTSQGKRVNFSDWYNNSGWRNMRISWLTQVTPSLGVIWGFGTGEKARKYSIGPSLTLGLAYQDEITKNGILSVKVTAIFGGLLKEKSCMADYGDIGGGEQEVNCRLAASTLPPAETLKYLFRERPLNHQKVLLSFSQSY